MYLLVLLFYGLFYDEVLLSKTWKGSPGPSVFSMHVFTQVLWCQNTMEATGLSVVFLGYIFYATDV